MNIEGKKSVKPIRVQLSRKRGWRMPSNTVSVARPGKWGNPYAINHKRVHIDGVIHDIPNRVTAVRMHREWIEHWLREIPGMLDPLRGKNLACWCPLADADGRPVPCHADVLLELANR